MFSIMNLECNYQSCKFGIEYVPKFHNDTCFRNETHMMVMIPS